MKYEEIIMKVAQAYGVAPPEVEAEMKAAVNAAKANPNFKMLFGEREPTLEEFILTITNKVLE